MKTKITCTLDEYEAQLLDRAIRVGCRLRGDGDEPESSNRRFILRWLIWSVCSAIIRNGEMSFPFAVDFRQETAEEQRQRLAKELPEGPQDAHRFIPPPNRWN